MNGDQWYPETPQEVKDAEEVQTAKVTASIPVIQEVLDWFEQKLTDHDSVRRLNINPDTDPVVALANVLATQTVTALFESKAAQFKADFAKYLDQKE